MGNTTWMKLDEDVQVAVINGFVFEVREWESRFAIKDDGSRQWEVSRYTFYDHGHYIDLAQAGGSIVATEDEAKQTAETWAFDHPDDYDASRPSADDAGDGGVA